jgi:hypothetical protein
VCITKETTLKGIRVLYLQINKFISADQRFHTFRTHLVCAIRTLDEKAKHIHKRQIHILVREDVT